MPETGDERRRSKRLARTVRARCGKAEGDELLVRRLRDVSSAGMFLVTDTTWEPGTELKFEILAEDDSTLVEGLARTVWVSPTGMGLEFLEIMKGTDVLDHLESDDEESRPEPAKVRTKSGKARTLEPELTIGVDLGTSNTCASVVLDGRPQVIPTRHGTNTIPSVVTLDDKGELHVGRIAARRMVLEPHRTIYGSKRLIGRTYRDELAEEYQPHFAYPIVETEDQRFGAGLEGRIISMQEVAASVLREVRSVAESHLRRRVDRAVITVPAYFNEVQRQAVRGAAKEAGLEVKRIVNEPTAAAVAYGYNRDERRRLAIFDLGGGTFDISVLNVDCNSFEVVATGGDNFLGGIDLDDLVASHLLEELCRVEGMDLVPTPQQLARLREAAEETKCVLSAQNRFAVHLPHFAQRDDRTYVDLVATIERKELNGLAEELIDRMISITSMVLGSAEVRTDTIDDVLLVGGMARMPLVQDRVESFFGFKPSRRINPDEAVAIGAALLAQDDALSSQVSLIDVLPLSIGLAGPGRRLERLLRRNTAVPASCSHKLVTSRVDQPSFDLPLFQGERADAAANEYLGTAIIRDLPKGPVGSQTAELLVELDEQGTLTLRAREGKSQAEIPVELDRSRKLEDVLRTLGPYRGETETSPRKTKQKKSALARMFSKLGGLFGKS